jgi:hypothetical protein
MKEIKQFICESFNIKKCINEINKKIKQNEHIFAVVANDENIAGKICDNALHSVDPSTCFNVDDGTNEEILTADGPKADYKLCIFNFTTTNSKPAKLLYKHCIKTGNFQGSDISKIPVMLVFSNPDTVKQLPMMLKLKLRSNLIKAF